MILTLLAATLLFLILLGIGSLVRRARLRDDGPPGSAAIPRWLTLVIRLAFILLVVTIILAAAAMVFALFRHLNGGAPPLAPAWFARRDVVWPAWILLLAASWGARYSLIQYAGDVAAYVYPYRVDRFHALRDRIKQRAREVTEAVYRATEDGTTPLYARVGLGW